MPINPKSPASQSPGPALPSALARLESRWGSAVVRLGGETNRQQPATAGALALAALPESGMRVAPLADDVVSTGFAHLDELLGTGGLPRGVSVSFRGLGSCGKTALALHCLAQAQAQGGIVAFLDLGRSFDPLEAAARGVDLHWLLILRPADLGEGWALAAALVAGRGVDLLVVDLPARLRRGYDEALRRLAAHARRSSVRLIVLEPAGLSPPVHGILAETVALRLELEQRAWLRAGRDVVGRRVHVNVAKNRFGPPGRATEIEIRYPVDGEHGPAIERYCDATPLSRLVPSRLPPRGRPRAIGRPA